MNRNAEEVRQRLPMRAAAEFYGFQPDRSGNINCPFHAGDRQASLHIYPGSGGFCCFGCGAKGSVIDFVMLLFGCSFGEALQRINEDFCLGLQLGQKMGHRQRRDRKDYISELNERRRQLREAEAECERLDTLYALADAFKRNYQPQDPEHIPDCYVWAVQNIDHIKYALLSAEEKRWNIEQIT